MRGFVELVWGYQLLAFVPSLHMYVQSYFRLLVDSDPYKRRSALERAPRESAKDEDIRNA